MADLLLSSLIDAARRPLAAHAGVLIDFPMPKHASGAYTPVKEEASVYDIATPFFTTGTWNLDGSGYAYASTAWALLLNTGAGNPAPSRGSYTRKYEVWGSSTATPATGSAVRIRFNILDGNNFVEVYIYWDGTQWQFVMDELVASVSNQRWNVNCNVIVDDPIKWHMVVYDAGDSLFGYLHVNESDVVGDDDAVVANYYAATRANQTYTGVQVGVRAVADGVRIRGIKISDV